MQTPSDILELPGTPITEPIPKPFFKENTSERTCTLGESEGKFLVFSKPLIQEFELQEGVILERNTYLLDTQEQDKETPKYVLLNFDLCKSTLGDILSNTEDLELFQRNISQEEGGAQNSCQLKSEEGIIKLKLATAQHQQLEVELNFRSSENEFYSSKHISLEKASEEKVNEIINLNKNI